LASWISTRRSVVEQAIATDAGGASGSRVPRSVGMFLAQQNRETLESTTGSMKSLKHLDRPSAWGLGNEVLYSLCSDYPGHSDPEVVVAKLWLIGRAYAAPLERGRPMPGTLRNESFYTGRAVPMVLDSPIDEWLAELGRASLSWGELPRILRAHGLLTDLFRSISGRAQRSLASKYLHFHRPDLFFIYDSRAAAEVRAEVARPRRVAVRREDVDTEYALFVRRCLELMESIAPVAPIPMTPRAIDRYLLGY
jgi:hypothetical protein